VLERQLGESFATVVVATYEPHDRILTYSCAGHPPPVVLGSSQPIAPITVSSSPPIGIGMRTGTRQTVVSVPGFSQVCFYTDGITEARVGSELFGCERLTSTLAEVGRDANASAFLDRVVEETDRRPDDMAACLLNIEGNAQAPTVLVEELELEAQELSSDRIERFLLACGLERVQAVERSQSAQMHSARAGTVLLGVDLAGGTPEVRLVSNNIASLHAAGARQRAALGVSR
jgi:hypothetical protein